MTRQRSGNTVRAQMERLDEINSELATLSIFDAAIPPEALFDRLDALGDMGLWGRDEANVWWREYRVHIQGRTGESYDGDERPTRTL